MRGSPSHLVTGTVTVPPRLLVIVTWVGVSVIGSGELNRWYMYWPASVKRDIVVEPPESGAVPGPLSQVAVSTVWASVALVFTSTDRKRWLSRLVNHSARSGVSVSVSAASADATARACRRSARFAA